jgi:hypothetical protein
MIKRIHGKKSADLWDLKVQNGVHNHEASMNAASHAIHRRIDSESQGNISSSLGQIGTAPRSILAAV